MCLEKKYIEKILLEKIAINSEKRKWLTEWTVSHEASQHLVGNSIEGAVITLMAFYDLQDEIGYSFLFHWQRYF